MLQNEGHQLEGKEERKGEGEMEKEGRERRGAMGLGLNTSSLGAR